jgi:hypothetical protein
LTIATRCGVIRRAIRARTRRVADGFVTAVPVGAGFDGAGFDGAGLDRPVLDGAGPVGAVFAAEFVAALAAAVPGPSGPGTGGAAGCRSVMRAPPPEG